MKQLRQQMKIQSIRQSVRQLIHQPFQTFQRSSRAFAKKVFVSTAILLRPKFGENSTKRFFFHLPLIAGALLATGVSELRLSPLSLNPIITAFAQECPYGDCVIHSNENDYWKSLQAEGIVPQTLELDAASDIKTANPDYYANGYANDGYANDGGVNGGQFYKTEFFENYRLAPLTGEEKALERSVGRLVCPVSAAKEVDNSTAFLVGKSGSVVVANLHPFSDGKSYRDYAIRDSTEIRKCQFKLTISGREISAFVDKIWYDNRFYERSRPDSASHDLAVVKLAKPLIEDARAQTATGLELGNYTKFKSLAETKNSILIPTYITTPPANGASFDFVQMYGSSNCRTYSPSRDLVRYAIGDNGIPHDCGMTRGFSGAPLVLLTPRGGKVTPVVIAVNSAEIRGNEVASTDRFRFNLQWPLTQWNFNAAVKITQTIIDKVAEFDVLDENPEKGHNKLAGQ